ncbi:MAG: sulfatase-like hydrolase/transferase [Planctomycetota bacterium]
MRDPSSSFTANERFARSRACSIVMLLLASVAVVADERPNVIVIYTDDHGYADLGCQGIVDDIRTPNIDRMAAVGVRLTDGYASAPQCVPSRGGLIAGMYQNRFGLESNPQGTDAAVMGRFDRLETVPERLQAAGYVTGMAGKWHLGPANEIHRHGFDHVFFKHSNAPGFWNMDLAGKDLEATRQHGGGYHLDLISDFACAFIERNHNNPFFFYLAYRAPHVPLDAPQKYLDRFPGEMPKRRRQALAMLSAVDDGIGRMVSTLEERGLLENTLIFLMGDNGAPLKIHKEDAPGGGPGWDGSLNDPLNGEKGMLSEGGIRTPFVCQWKGTLPSGQVFRKPVMALDAMATALAVAGCPDASLDGVNLIPFLKGDDVGQPHETLYWRWLSQSAVRQGNWKYLRLEEREYLFDLESDAEETTNVLDQHPMVAKQLYGDLNTWSQELSPPGLDSSKSEAMSRQGNVYFDWYLDGIRTTASQPASKPKTRQTKNQPKHDPSDIFSKRDDNGDERVTWEEFLNERTGDTVPTIRRNFERYDLDGNGTWERAEVPK